MEEMNVNVIISPQADGLLTKKFCCEEHGLEQIMNILVQGDRNHLVFNVDEHHVLAFLTGKNGDVLYVETIDDVVSNIKKYTDKNAG